jgi:hypothetical protein
MRQQADETNVRAQNHRQVQVRRKGTHDRERDRHPEPGVNDIKLFIRRHREAFFILF